MEIETTPWYETRSLISPQIEMLQEDGMIQYKKSFLKTESPKSATLKARFIHYNVNYIKYCFIKEFYQLLFDGVRQGIFNENDDDYTISIVMYSSIIEFVQYCREQPSEENALILFRAFCKAHLYRSAAKGS